MKDPKIISKLLISVSFSSSSRAALLLGRILLEWIDLMRIFIIANRHVGTKELQTGEWDG